MSNFFSQLDAGRSTEPSTLLARLVSRMPNKKQTPRLRRSQSAPSEKKYRLKRAPSSLATTPVRVQIPDYRRAPFICDAWWYPSDSEILILRNSWSRDEEFQKTVATKTFFHILSNLKTAGKLFPKIDRSTKSVTFQKHAKYFTNAMNFAVENLENEVRMTRYFRDIGASHCQFVSRGFRVAYWELFKPAIQAAVSSQWTGSQFVQMSAECKERAERLWGLLAILVVRIMFVGFCKVLAALDQSTEGADTKL